MSDLIYANSAISAHMSKHMLNHARIHAIIRAKTDEQINEILAECGYATKGNIIEAEFERAYKKFLALCPDDALNDCVTAIYNFKTKKAESVEGAEKELLFALEQSVDKIKFDKTQQYFKTYISALIFNKKIPETKLFTLANDMKHDNTTIGPIFYWYVLKQSEFITLKSIFLGKRMGFDSEKILQHLKKVGLYERFA